MASFEAATTSLPAGRGRAYDSAVEVLLYDEIEGFELVPEEIYLDRIKATALRQGFGTRAMQMLTGLADKHGIHLLLHAQADHTREGVPSTSDLVDFYKKHGFFKCGSNNMMTRRPAGYTPTDGPV